jgi:hypothetical protein
MLAAAATAVAVRVFVDTPKTGKNSKGICWVRRTVIWSFEYAGVAAAAAAEVPTEQLTVAELLLLVREVFASEQALE